MQVEKTIWRTNTHNNAIVFHVLILYNNCIISLSLPGHHPVFSVCSLQLHMALAWCYGGVSHVLRAAGGRLSSTAAAAGKRANGLDLLYQEIKVTEVNCLLS